MRRAAFILAACAAIASLALAAAKPRVSMEIVTKPGLSLTASRDWYKALTDLGVAGLQIRSAAPADEMGIKEQGGKGDKQYRVTGVLAADGVLYLPGGKFKLQDSARLGKWLADLGDGGSEGVTQPRGAFGLTPRQLADVHDDLQMPIAFSTKEMSAAKAVEKIRAGLHLPLVLGDAARGELAEVRIVDEMMGLSRGTALAALLRPAGLGLRPERPAGGELQYRIDKLQAGRESWPVGWKPKRGGAKPLAELFEFLNVEINDTTVGEAVEAIQGRLKAPFLFDHNALAVQNIDPAKLPAEVPQKRMTYSQILGKVLSQARLKFELRLDDGDRPFLWITTIKPAA
jgi:hypothetical protein